MYTVIVLDAKTGGCLRSFRVDHYWQAATCADAIHESQGHLTAVKDERHDLVFTDPCQRHLVSNGRKP